MTVSVNISRPLVDSFVHRKIKLSKTKGSGEAKFHIGSAENSGDFDSFLITIAMKILTILKK